MDERNGVISYDGLVELVEKGVISGVEMHRINSASIDITVGNVFFVEKKRPMENRERSARPLIVIHDDPMKRRGPQMEKIVVPEGSSIILAPGEVCLAQSREVFNLPMDISAQYVEKSSMGRSFLQHMHAGWCDAGWHGSVLTLELKNDTEDHDIQITPGVGIGQMIFNRHAPVPRDRSYAARGRYNKDNETSEMKR